MANPNSKSANASPMFAGLFGSTDDTAAVSPAPAGKRQTAEEKPKENTAAKHDEPKKKDTGGAEPKQSAKPQQNSFKANYTKQVKARADRNSNVKTKRKTVYLTNNLSDKVDRAVEKGEIKSFNDLINEFLMDYFND